MTAITPSLNASSLPFPFLSARLSATVSMIYVECGAPRRFHGRLHFVQITRRRVPTHRNHLCATKATIAGTRKITKNIGNSSRNAYPARATPKYIFTAATKNHTTTNAIVAVPIAREEFPDIFAAATKIPQTTNPPKIISAVRMHRSFAKRRAYHITLIRPRRHPVAAIVSQAAGLNSAQPHSQPSTAHLVRAKLASVSENSLRLNRLNSGRKPHTNPTTSLRIAAQHANKTFSHLFSLILMFTATQTHAAPPDKSTAPQLIELAKSNSPQLHDAIVATFDAKDLQAGKAFIGQGPEFFFATESASKPALFIDDAAGPEMHQIAGSNLWYTPARIERLGTSHTFHYLVAHEKFGGSYDVPVYTPDSYQHPDVPAGKLSEKLTHTSKIYDGMKSDYWIYVPAQYDPKTPAALLVVQDGEGYIDREGKNKTLNVVDNLIAQKKIPVMIVVFINPGDISGSPGTPTYTFVEAYGKKWNRTLKDSMRSTLYDTVSDRYPRFLRDEVLAEVSSKVQHSQRRLQPLHHRPLLRRHLLFQRRVAAARSIRPRHFLDRQLLRHSVERRSVESRRRPGLSRQNSCASPSATSASGSRTAPKISISATATGRSPISAWPTPSKPPATISISVSAAAPTTPPTAPPNSPPK